METFELADDKHRVELYQMAQKRIAELEASVEHHLQEIARAEYDEVLATKRAEVAEANFLKADMEVKVRGLEIERLKAKVNRLESDLRLSRSVHD